MKQIFISSVQKEFERVVIWRSEAGGNRGDNRGGTSD